MSSVRLFVYGSLKRSGQHHDELRAARFLGLAETTASYTLVTLEGAGLGPRDTRPTSYPALVSGGDSSISGELFEVDERLLEALDEFEGPEYERASVSLKNDQIGVALAYLLKAR